MRVQLKRRLFGYSYASRSSFSRGGRIAVIAISAVLVIAFGLPALANCPNERSAPLEPKTATLAGNGYPRISGGPEAAASFIAPVGVAVGPDGSVYVADADAQDIRRIHDGTVDVFAGTAPDGVRPQRRVGGYLDGPALKARFSRPMGVAVAKDGTVYVADGANHLIRKISRGIVTTFAKTTGDPYGIAVDDDGIVYVADFGGGVDKITPDGTLTTLTYSTEKTVCGIYVRGSGKNRILAYTDLKGIHLVKGDVARYVASDDKAEPYQETHLVGAAWGIVAFDDNSVAVSDDFESAVRFVRFPIASPVGAPAMVRVLSGGRKPGALSIAGYRDGLAEQSMLDLPRGLALNRDGSILVADSGNRRIRVITGVDPRGPVLANGDGTMAVPTQPAGSYRVVVIGNSLTFADALWPDSIPGQIEQGLIRDRVSLGLKACPNVIAYRFSSGGISDFATFLGTYYGDHEADLVVFMLDTNNLAHELESIPPLPPQSKTPAQIESDYPELQLRLKKLRDTVRSGGAAFVMSLIPDGRGISPLETLWRDSFFDFDMKSQLPGFRSYSFTVEFERLVKETGIRTLDLFPPMLQAEESPGRVPLYNHADVHPTIDGSILIGRLTLEGLEKWRPWKNWSPGKQSPPPS